MRATALLAVLAAVALSRGAKAQLNAIQSAEETALNAYSAFKNLQLGRTLNTSASALPLNGTLTCFLDPATSTIVGLGVSSTSSPPPTQKPQLCGKTSSPESLAILSPIVAVSVGIQKVGLGVAALRFTTAGGGGDLFCGYQANTLKTFEATSSSNWGLSRGTLASIDAKCANVSGREVLTAGEIALTFTSSTAVGGSFPLYAGVSAPAAAAVDVGTEATTQPPPASSPTPTPAATPSAPPSTSPVSTPAAATPPPPPPPAATPAAPASQPPPPSSPSTSPPPPSSTPSAAAVSWMESIVKPDPILAARVKATEVEGQSAADVAPPMLGVGAASDHVIIGGKLPTPMPGETAAAASAAVSDLPGAGVGVLSGAGKAADTNGSGNDTLSLVSTAGVRASGDGDGGNGSERQQLAGDGGESSSDPSSDNSAISYASGTSGVSFTDSRAPTYLDDTKKVGQLYVCKAVSNGACSSWSFCTASLVGKSLLVTAAHCVFSYGKKTGGWPSYIGGQLQVYFFPQVNDNVGPYGSWAAQDVTVPSSYYNGIDTCARNGPGVVCSNDLALVWLKPGGNTSPPQQAGERLGYNAYGFNNWGMSTPSTATGISSATFQSVFGTLPSVMITQLGYPVAFENGNTIQISAAPAYRYYVSGSETTTGQTMLNLMKGSAVTGGASGGPWIVNFGSDAKSMTTGTNYGAFATRDVVVGVTSWGFSSSDVKTSATSVFGQNAEFPAASYGTRGGGNIGFLIDWACDNAAGTWKLQGKGMCT